MIGCEMNFVLVVVWWSGFFFKQNYQYLVITCFQSKKKKCYKFITYIDLYILKCYKFKIF